MNAELISIGDELLIGQVLDSNSNWIARELTKIGVTVNQIRIIPDEELQILSSLKTAQSNADIVIITGGLGPTKDDITKETIARYFDDKLVLHSETEDAIKKMFKKINYPFTELNALQAMIPSKCEPLKNEWGTAPGMWFYVGKKVVVVLPGVPNEMKGIMSTAVLPRLKALFNLPIILNKTILTYGMGESMVAERIETWEESLPSFIRLAYLPSYGRVRLRLTARGDDENLLNQAIDAEVFKLTELIGDIIVGFEDTETIEYSIGQLLRSADCSLAVAESCTGGKIASLITSIPGASKYFKGGVVAYQASLKSSELGVSKALIRKHSVVSAEVAVAMAAGIREKFNTDYGIATTGNAGPTKDHTDKSVGTVFIAVLGPNGHVVEKYFFGKPREKVIDRTAVKALEMLKKEILKN